MEAGTGTHTISATVSGKMLAPFVWVYDLVVPLSEDETAPEADEKVPSGENRWDCCCCRLTCAASGDKVGASRFTVGVSNRASVRATSALSPSSLTLPSPKVYSIDRLLDPLEECLGWSRNGIGMPCMLGVCLLIILQVLNICDRSSALGSWSR